MTKQRVRGASRFVVMCLLWSVVASCGGPGTPATNDLTYFAIEADDNPGLGADAVGTINVDSVTVLVPAGTNLTSLKATFQTTGTSVAVGAVVVVGGTDPDNVAIQGFTVNRHTASFDLAVFGFAPQDIQAAP